MAGRASDLRGRLRPARVSSPSSPDPIDIDMPRRKTQQHVRRRQTPSPSVESQASSSPGPRQSTRFLPSRPIIDWHGPLCQLLKIDEDSSIANISEALEDAAAKLELAENLERFMPSNAPALQSDFPPRWEVINRIRCKWDDLDEQDTLYLGDPYIVKRGPQNAHLVGSEAITDGLDLHLEKNKDIIFIVYRDYECCSERPPQPHHRSEKLPPSTPSNFLAGETIEIVSEDLSEALQAVAKVALYDVPTPTFEVDQAFAAPFLWWYHRREEIAEAQRMLDKKLQEHISALYEYITESLESEWSKVDSLLAEGKISAQYIDYLFVPNTMVIIRDPVNIAQSEAFISSSWLKPLSEHLFSLGPSGNRSYSSNGFIEAVYWTYDGTFQKRTSIREIKMLPSISAPFEINQLAVFPMSYVEEKVRDAIRARGEMLWKCRRQHYVCYSDRWVDGIQNTSDPRFMVDYATYKLMHPPDPKKPKALEPPSLASLEPGMMDQDEPPYGDEFVMCLPTQIPGYNMQKKDWITLDISRITAVVWNTKAFDTLVIDAVTKELVSALVTNQIDVERNTDLMSGKGNGLFILLHGGPGTGKTLTAESVAEFAKKPLYRVTCGDIGTKAEEVEKYLEVVLLLGKIWGCVVLLDEADVFLEQRTLFDLQRNALVSVFLRVLEYYDGILILTSNRVGTFDEAFKSRIQLSLRYKNLGLDQRLQVWDNFITRLESFQTAPQIKKTVTVPTVNGGVDLGIEVAEIRKKLPELAKVELNGREIRNAVSTARQLAMFKGVPMGYSHLESVIEEAKKFNEYLLELQKGITADQKKNRQGER